MPNLNTIMRVEEAQEEKAGRNRVKKEWFYILNRNVEEIGFLWLYW